MLRKRVKRHGSIRKQDLDLAMPRNETIMDTTLELAGFKWTAIIIQPDGKSSSIITLSPGTFAFHLPFGGKLRVFPNLLEESTLATIWADMWTRMQYQQNKVQGLDEPPVHTIYHKDALCNKGTELKDAKLG